MITIVRIENAGPGLRARRLVFNEYGESRTTAGAVVRVLGITEGSTFDEGQLAKDLHDAEITCANNRAMRLLGYRERSTAELLGKIADDGYPRALAEEITGRFTELGYVDDTRFAEAFIRTRAAAGLGVRRIANELAQKGVDPGLAAGAIEQHIGDSEDERAAQALGNRNPPADAKERDKLTRRLVARGFSYGVARTAIDAMGPHDVQE